MSTRRIYTDEFKTAAVSRLSDGGDYPSYVSRELGVTMTQLETWKLEQQAAGSPPASALRSFNAPYRPPPVAALLHQPLGRNLLFPVTGKRNGRA